GVWKLSESTQASSPKSAYIPHPHPLSTPANANAMDATQMTEAELEQLLAQRKEKHLREEEEAWKRAEERKHLEEEEKKREIEATRKRFGEQKKKAEENVEWKRAQKAVQIVK
ncbi:hypothetical protein K503DRAFT_788369, partial [Rhizopogon vinicolor AM-OR11-026]